MTSESEFLSAYERIKASHRNILTLIDKAIEHEENERHSLAIVNYESCIQNIDETFAIPVGLPQDIEAVQPEWNDACTIIQKLKGAKTELTYRLKVLRTQVKHTVDQTAVEATDVQTVDSEEPEAKKKPSMLFDNPPTYYDISNAEPKTYREIINALRDVITTENSGVILDTVFQSGVKLYKILPNGLVATVAGETSMSLVMCTVGGKWQFLNGIFYIQCEIPEVGEGTLLEGDQRHNVWIYPLVPAVTTCYHTDYGAFILPDMESDMTGTAFGIMLSDSEDSVDLSDLQQFFLDLLEAVIAGKVEELQQPIGERVPRDTSKQVSKHIVTTADFIARNLVRTAEKTGELMLKSTPYIISKLNAAPADTPPVSSTLSTSVEVAKNVSTVAVNVTGWVAGKVGAATMAVGKFLAPHIQNGGAALLERGLGYDTDEANSKMEGALTIAAGAVEGFSTVFQGLEKSAVILGTNLSDNSVKIIEHKYGPSAGNVAAGTFDTLGNAFHVTNNVHYFTPKGIARKMVKNTGKAVVDDYKSSLRNDSHIVLAGTLYPDLRSCKEKQF